ncbi:preprotein translocase subunit SecY [Halalkalicoccus jeotgali]|uniref:Protein translocase subunit SecY n=2 Tax=Halalkalicoccus jeotgali (strain DSM 18796 / CECT 7217 / JCM 14584 / KCTC 4019 / B3) TaxID=795797 RepID=L9VSX2_HALJB|nr:preprotein translocase subunit SecY [Halalkalicoccus jeotgali]ELY40136.1 preprotein translocase subunit SecY [Halalkalicoccus jeotgali B3]
MSWKEAAEPVLTRMPGVTRPEGHVPFKRKLAWTAGVLVVYFFLTNVYLWGLPSAEAGQDIFGQFRSILAGSQGTILQVGIGPIVTASIVLQLLGGAGLLGLDTNDPRDQVLYQGLQKLLVIVMIALTAFPMVFLGGFLPASPELAATYGQTTVQTIIFAQVFVGGIFVLFLDEIVSKWGVGSGIGLFIIAGVSQRLIGGLFAWSGLPGEAGIVPTWFSILLGQASFPSLLTSEGLQELFLGQGALLAILTTIFIFVVVVYAESVRVEVPLSHARVKGARGRFPVKLIYASVLPMILVRALQMNVQFAGRILDARWAGMPAWLGVYNSQGQPTGGLFYYLNPIQAPEEWMWWLGEASQAVWQIMLRVGIDLAVMVIGGAVFAIFWVQTTDMGPEATARQIQNSGMQIPGFRQNIGVYEKVLGRYIPQVTVIGGALVGLLAVMANMLGTIGAVSGTGLLLAVSITYKLYEEIAEEQMMEMHPMMRQMFGD